jgi:hypothetical protein
MTNKKQLFETVEGICELNNKWGNTHGTHDAKLGASLLIEEALEGICVVNAKEVSRNIVSKYYLADPEPVDSFDSACDAIYISIGNLHKMGLTPHQIADGLAAVHKCNLAKSGTQDSHGKITKPTDFVGPEDKLQSIIDNH